VLTTAHIGHWEEFGWKLWTLAMRYGLDHAGDVVLVADGAAWIDTLQRAFFPEAERLLDFWHAMEHICDAGRTAYGDDERNFTAWRQAQKGRLAAGDLPAVVASLNRLCRRRPRDADLGRIVTATVAYLTARSAIMDYPRFREAIWPIGSGLIEGRIKTLVKSRLCGPGMRWAVDRANAMLAVRTQLRNNQALALSAAA
jgi:hypothetical protein